MADFPTVLTDAVNGPPGIGTEIVAKHLNNLEAKVGIDGSAIETSLDYLIKHRYSMMLFVGDPAYPTFTAAITTLNGAGTLCTLVVPAGVHAVNADLTVNSNINLVPLKGADIQIATTKTLTLNGPFCAGPYKVFTCIGTSEVVFGPGTIQWVYAEWLGATGDGTTDDTIPIMAAITAHPRVRLLDKTYSVSDLAITALNHRHLDGAGPDKTILAARAGTVHLINFSDSAFSGISNMTLKAVSGMTGVARFYGVSSGYARNLRIGFVGADPGVDNGINGITIEGAPSFGSYNNNFSDIYITYLTGKLVYIKNDDSDTASRVNANQFSNIWAIGSVVSEVNKGTALHMANGNSNTFINCYAQNCAKLLSFNGTSGLADGPSGNLVAFLPDPHDMTIERNATGSGNYITAMQDTGVAATDPGSGNVLHDKFNLTIGSSNDANSGFRNFSKMKQIGNVIEIWKNTSEANARTWFSHVDGSIWFGDGTATQDVCLYRFNNHTLALYPGNRFKADRLFLPPLSAAPTDPAPSDGEIFCADRITWDPLSKGSGGSYLVRFNGSTYVAIDAQ